MIIDPYICVYSFRITRLQLNNVLSLPNMCHIDIFRSLSQYFDIFRMRIFVLLILTVNCSPTATTFLQLPCS